MPRIFHLQQALVPYRTIRVRQGISHDSIASPQLFDLLHSLIGTMTGMGPKGPVRMLHVNKRLNTAILALLLLFGQSAVLVHSIEHPYFAHKANCVLCQFGQQHKSAVQVANFFLPPCKQDFVVTHCVVPPVQSTTFRHYQTRAPPSIS